MFVSFNSIFQIGLDSKQPEFCVCLYRVNYKFDDTINLFLIFLVHDLHSPILLKYSPLFKAICPRTMVIVKLYNQNIYNMGHFTLLVEFGLQALYLIVCVDEI